MKKLVIKITRFKKINNKWITDSIIYKHGSEENFLKRLEYFEINKDSLDVKLKIFIKMPLLNMNKSYLQIKLNIELVQLI